MKLFSELPDKTQEHYETAARKYCEYNELYADQPYIDENSQYQPLWFKIAQELWDFDVRAMCLCITSANEAYRGIS